MADDDRGILGLILHDMADFVGLLANLVSDEATMRAAFGFSVDAGLVTQLTVIGDEFRSAADPDPDIAKFAAAAGRLAGLTDAVELIVQAAEADLPAGLAVEEATGLLLDAVASVYIGARAPFLLHLARLLGFATDNIRWDDLGTALREGWDGLTGPLETEDDARRLSTWFVALGLLFAYVPALVNIGHRRVNPRSVQVLQGWEGDPQTSTPVGDRISERFVTILLTLPFEQVSRAGTTTAEEELTFTLTFALVPREHGGPGLWLSFGFGGEFDGYLGDGWHLVAETQVTDGFEVFVGGESAVEKSFYNAVGTSGGEIGLRLERRDEGTITTPGGGPSTSTPAAPWRRGEYLEVKAFELGLTARDREPLLEGKVSARDAALTIPRPDSGFFRSLVPEGGYRVEFDVALIVDSTPQISVEGGAGLEVTIPIRTSTPKLQGLHLYLALRNRKDGDPDAVPPLSFEASTGFGTKLGAFSATVDRLGVVLPHSPHGLPGVPWLKLPNAVGVGIDTKGVKGGGFVLFDPEHGRYAGTFSLTFAKWTIAAFGLVTDLPDGYSLLVVLSIEWPNPIPGPFGIGIKGIGGILGHNHSADVGVLQNSMRTGAVSTILFPENPATAAPKVLTTLGNVFPVRPGSSLIGIGLKLTWSGGLVTLLAALISESGPTPRTIILASMETVAPDKDLPLVRIKWDAVGIFDGTRPSVEIDGSLHDSFIGGLALTGDGAFRFHGGDNGVFLLSIGGFHPSYIPPASPNLPPQRRLTLALPSGNPRLRLEQYYALTSNSIQMGAKLEVSARAGGFSAEALLSFDGIVERHPFHFAVDIQGRAAIRYDGSTLASVGLDLHVEGPHPWRVKGKATLSLFFFSVSVPIHYVSGEEAVESITQADAAALLAAALADPAAWETTRPAGAAALVALRAPAADGLAAHPAGQLGVRQSALPLGVDITHVGAAAIAPDRFDITTLTVNGTAAPLAEVRAPFAAGEFVDLSADEKLSRPAFEPFRAGVSAGGAAVTAGPVSAVDLSYEQITLGSDGPLDDTPPRRAALGVLVAHGVLFGAAAASPIRRDDFVATVKAQPLVTLSDATSVVVDAVTLTPVGAAGPTGTELRQAALAGQRVIATYEAVG
jgi:Family of unknown function (DUF6603)